MYINNVGHNITDANLCLYADDTVVYLHANTVALYLSAFDTILSHLFHLRLLLIATKSGVLLFITATHEASQKIYVQFYSYGLKSQMADSQRAFTNCGELQRTSAWKEEPQRRILLLGTDRPDRIVKRTKDNNMTMMNEHV